MEERAHAVVALDEGPADPAGAVKEEVVDQFHCKQSWYLRQILPTRTYTYTVQNRLN